MPEMIITRTYGRQYYDLAVLCHGTGHVKSLVKLILYSLLCLLEFINLILAVLDLQKLILSSVGFIRKYVLNKLGVSTVNDYPVADIKDSVSEACIIALLMFSGV